MIDSDISFTKISDAVNPTALVGVAAYSLKVPRSCRYQKLVEETNSDLLLTVPSKFGDQPKSDETDSVGSASDLQVTLQLN